jgi:hypothetical protein
MTDATKRTAAALAAVAALVCAGLAATAPSAGALTLLRCTGSTAATYTPALTDTPTRTVVAATTTYSGCLNALGLSERRTGSTSGSSTVPDASCLDLLVPGRGQEVVDWSTGGSSAYQYTATANEVDGVFQRVASGTVVSGEFTGATVVTTTTIPALDPLACAGAGVPSASGLATITIVGL